ncbi:ATPase [bacterium]|nr:ATPase [bacterium]
MKMNQVKKSWLLVVGLMLSSVSAFAEEAGHAASAAMGGDWAKAFAGALGIALAVIAASTAQGKIAVSYMDGVSRNPGAQKGMGTQLILSLVFVETLVLFTVAIIFVKM